MHFGTCRSDKRTSYPGILIAPHFSEVRFDSPVCERIFSVISRLPLSRPRKFNIRDVSMHFFLYLSIILYRYERNEICAKYKFTARYKIAIAVVTLVAKLRTSSWVVRR